MNFKQNLKTIRRSLKLTQRELASKCGITQADISHYERGYVEPNLNKLYKLSKGLNLPISTITNFSKYMNKEININYSFCNNLKAARLLRGLNQTELAERCNSSTTDISELEHSIHLPNLSSLIKLCEALEIDIDELTRTN